MSATLRRRNTRGAEQITEIELVDVTESIDSDELSTMSEASPIRFYMAASTVGQALDLSTLATMNDFDFDR